MLATIYAKLLGLALIVLVIGGCWFYVHHLHTMIDELEATNKVLVTNAHTLQTALDTQNAATLKLKTDADAKLASAQVEISKAHAATIVAQKTATVIYKAAPPAASATCEVREKTSLDLINGSTP